MGTRSLTFVYEGVSKKPNVVMYRQMDGYPSGHGLDLAEFLRPIKMVNGLGVDDAQIVANGAGCLAAQMVAHFKTDPGGIYLVSSGCHHGQEYEYLVTVLGDNTIEVACHVPKARKPLFKGNVADFEAWCKRQK